MMLCYVNIQEVHLLEINFFFFKFYCTLELSTLVISAARCIFSPQLLPALASSTVCRYRYRNAHKNPPPLSQTHALQLNNTGLFLFFNTNQTSYALSVAATCPPLVLKMMWNNYIF